MKRSCFKGCFCSKAAFTLIELLVVVLIIGILAAVAVPQYRLAVEKSRAAEALSVLKTISAAQEVYYLANGSYASDLSLLDMEVPTSNFFTYKYHAKGMTAHRDNREYMLSMRYQHGSEELYKLVCGPLANENEEKARQICKRLGADLSKNDNPTGSARWPIVK